MLFKKFLNASVMPSRIELVFDGDNMPSFSSGRISLFFAPYTAFDQVGGGDLADEGEQIIVLQVPLTELLDSMADGEINDKKRSLLICTVYLHRQRLFDAAD